MKNFKVVVVALVMSIEAISCSDDDSDSAVVVNNVMELAGQQYDIDSALLESYGENEDGSYDWDVTFLSGLTYDSETELYSGDGSFLYLDLNTDSAGGLVPGIYTYSPEYVREAFKWVFAASGTYVDTANESGDFLYYNQGTVTITGTGEDQIITVDLLTESGETNTTATYKGSFQFVDYSTTKKNKKK